MSAVLYEVKDRVAVITLNTPEKMNALSNAMTDGLLAALEQAKNDTTVKAIVLTGAGRAFCAGGDVGAFADLTIESSVAMMQTSKNAVKAFRDMPKPIIAAVNGFAVGAGFSLALLCDLVIASEKAKFGMAFVNMGLIPDMGALYALPKIVGVQKAKELALTGKNISAQEAKDLGIVGAVVPAEELDAAAMELAGQLSRQPGFAMSMIKKLLNQSADLSQADLMESEAVTQAMCLLSEDSKEAVDAFLNKRKPNFK